jgi:hypothetical protein
MHNNNWRRSSSSSSRWSAARLPSPCRYLAVTCMPFNSLRLSDLDSRLPSAITLEGPLADSRLLSSSRVSRILTLVYHTPLLLDCFTIFVNTCDRAAAPKHPCIHLHFFLRSAHAKPSKNGMVTLD